MSQLNPIIDTSDDDDVDIDCEKKTAKTLDLYFKLQEEYMKKYGESTVLFMQVGTFYESYATDTTGFKIGQLESMINATLTRKNKKRNEAPSKSNPYLLGFPVISLQKNLKTLVNKGLTVVLYDQVQSIVSTEKKKDGEIIINDAIKTDRVFAGLFTASTYIDEQSLTESSYIMTVYVAEEKQLRGLPLFAYGLTMVDMITGKSFVHEFYGKTTDEKFGTDEIIRLINGYSPKKTIYYLNLLDANEKKIDAFKNNVEFNSQRDSLYLYANDMGTDTIELLTKDTFNRTIQNDYLSKIFAIEKTSLANGLSVIDILDLEKYSYGTISLMIMLQFISKHNITLIDHIVKPTIYMYTEHLILGNNAVNQLNVIDSGGLDTSNAKFTSLLDVVDQTKTLMGRRLLRESLLNPLSRRNKNHIQQRYDMIAELISYDKLNDLIKELSKIADVERLHRKLATNKINPYEFVQLDMCYKTISRVLSMVRESKLSIAKLIDENHLKKFLTIQIEYDKIFDFDALQLYTNFNDIQQNIFKENVNNKLTDMVNDIDYAKKVIILAGDYFYSLIKKSIKLKKGETEAFELCNNKADGWFIKVSNARAVILQDALKSMPNEIIIKDANKNKIKLDKSKIKFDKLKSKTNIIIESLKSQSNDIVMNKFKLNELTRIEFYKQITKLYESYHLSLYAMSDFIAKLDFMVSGAVVAKRYSYVKPIISTANNPGSYLTAKSLRHPIIERLCKETEYIPNDIALGNVPNEVNTNGILLYGLNSSGKSALMKSVGLAIILAQIGYYVPATRFEYDPYTSIYARITGNDNMFKAESSFLLEMHELDAIINRSEGNGLNTLVIGDEVCRGTESISGISLVASTLVHLSEQNTSFIFSSHLHELTEISQVKALENMQVFHLHVEYDTVTNSLKYFRNLRSGSGPSIYGLLVAKSVIKNTKFINIAEQIKKNLMAEFDKKLVTKKSNYNNQLLIRCCAMCQYTPINDSDKELETHHINFQKNCSADGKIKAKPHLSKNELYNLVVLCRKCHESVHNGKITINGYIDTNIGPMLDYKFNIGDYDKSKKIHHNLSL